MARWAEFTAEVPEFAAFVEGRLRAHKFLVMATVRPDGAPRVCGTEIMFREGDLWLGGMPGALRFKDLRRDPRVVIHGTPDDEATWRGDAKVGGRAIEVTEPEELDAFRDPNQPPGDFELFRVDVTEASTVRLEDPPVALIIESWQEGRPLKRVER
jgi:uncharacterized pyridoxamine 5'-phosphate oxidase family protein